MCFLLTFHVITSVFGISWNQLSHNISNHFIISIGTICLVTVLSKDNQGALHEPLHEPGKSCGEIRSCRPECPVHQVHQGIVSECPDHHRPLPHRTAVLNSVEYDFSNGPVEGINRRIKSLKRSFFGFRNLDNFRKRIALIRSWRWKQPLWIHFLQP